jgi:fructokinase
VGAFPARQYKDATGCGDWCSAGIIDRLCAYGRRHFMRLSETEIVRGIRFGQALATINCEYEGARGPMYRMTSSELRAKVQDILALDQHRIPVAALERA